MTEYRGTCICESVSFTIKGELRSFFICHCSRCQKITGSAHAANIFTSAAELKFTRGEDKVKDFYLSGSRFCTSFCKECGSKVPTLMESGTLMIPAGSLDSEFNLKPKAHIFMDSRAHWEDDLAAAEKLPGLP